jgi:hypothetical protein
MKPKENLQEKCKALILDRRTKILISQIDVCDAFCQQICPPDFLYKFGCKPYLYH